MTSANAIKLQIHFPIDSKMTIILIYRDCSSSKIDFVNELEEIIESGEENVVILGDMNINILTGEDSDIYLNVIAAKGYISKFNEPTRDSNCLDHVLVQSQRLELSVERFMEKISDHAILGINILDGDNPEIGGEHVTNKSYTIIEEGKLLDCLQNADWSWVDDVNCENVDSKFDKLILTIQDCQHRATKTINTDTRLKFRKHWATPALVILSKSKAKAYDEWRRERNNIDLREKFKYYSALVKKEIRKAQQTYYNKLLDERKTKPKEYWRIINNLRSSKQNENITAIEMNNKIITVDENPDLIANEFNKYFNNVPVNLLHQNNLINLPINEREFANLITDCSLDSFQLTSDDVHQAITRLKNKKSAAIDGISSNVFKKLPNMMSKILTPLYNTSLKSGHYPTSLQISIILPRHKQGDKAKINNYRPVANTSVISVIFEKAVKEKLLNYLEHIQFFASQQFGFLRNKSTDLALFHHLTTLTNIIENKNAALGIYLDLAKAFDTISHKILFLKLKQIGIKDPLLSWINSYLTTRKYATKIGNAISTKIPSHYGVPQGGVLSAILFLVYINDLYNLPLSASILGYADDTSLLYNGKSRSEIETNFKQDFELLYPWFKTHRLHLNINKCKYIAYGYKTPPWADHINLTIGLEKLQRGLHVKYLGVMIDEKLSWKEQSIYIQSKLRKVSYIFFHMKKLINQYHLKKLYQPLFESILNYGIIH
jgi:hypothetical protein